MIPVIDLNTNVVPTRGRAYAIPFVTQRGQSKTIFVGLSVAEVREGKFWVREFIMHPNQDGLRVAFREGWTPLIGSRIEAAPIDEPKTSPVIKKGYFTVECEGERHRTFKIKTNRNGNTAIGLLVGSNNTRDYAWFGYLNGDGSVDYWGSTYDRYRNPMELPISRETVKECVAAILGNPDEAGTRYARTYENCSRCGRVLTNPESITLGLGTECAGLRYGASKR